MATLRWIKLLESAPHGRDVDIPASVAQRSVEGDTLILVPGQSYEVTEEEWALLEANHKDLLKWVRTLREPSP